jgi:hypothetical protein
LWKRARSAPIPVILCLKRRKCGFWGKRGEDYIDKLEMKKVEFDK